VTARAKETLGVVISLLVVLAAWIVVSILHAGAGR